MIAPSITYTGTVTGRLVHPPATLRARLQRCSSFGQVAMRAGITGTDALDFIRGYYVD